MSEMVAGCREITGVQDADGLRAQKVDEYKAHFANLCVVAERGYIDDALSRARRPKLIEALRMLETKRVLGRDANTAESRCELGDAT